MEWLSRLCQIAFICAGLYVLVAVLVTLLQRRLIFKPDPRRTTPDEAGHSNVEVWTIPTPDGETLTAWFSPAAPGKPTFLYFHGNAGWIELRSSRLNELASRGFGVLMPSMRSYGGSTGKPFEIALVADARLMYRCLRTHGIKASDIIAFGESLGTGLATQVAATQVVGGLVLDSPYTSMIDLAQRRYRWLPVKRLLWDHFETVRHIRSVLAPVIILHGEADELVPVDMAYDVLEAANAPKTLRIYPRAPHLDHGGQGSFDHVAAWVASIRATRTENTKPEPSPMKAARDRVSI